MGGQGEAGMLDLYPTRGQTDRSVAGGHGCENRLRVSEVGTQLPRGQTGMSVLLSDSVALS